MGTDLTRKKLREANFFLGELATRDGDSRLDKEEEFGFFVSAFLAAARSVESVLARENPNTHRAKRAAWLASLDPGTKEVLEFMRVERNTAVHGGTDAAVKRVEYVPAVTVLASRTHFSASVIAQVITNTDGAVLGVARYMLTPTGMERPAVEVCRQYLGALEQLVQLFEG